MLVSFWKVISLILPVLVVSTFVTDCASAKAPAADNRALPTQLTNAQQIVVLMSAFSDNRNGVFWSLDMSNRLQEKGAKVTVMLFAEAVRLADNRTPQQFEESIQDLPFWKAFDDFVSSGGKVLVESSTANRLGIVQANLRAGAQLADDGDMADAILSSGKVLYFGASLGD